MRKRFNLPSLYLFFLFFMGMAAPSCRGAVKTNMELEPQALSKPGLVHALHSEKLRLVMNELKGVAYDRLPPEMDVHAQRERHFEAISRSADAMSNAAARMSEILPELELTNDARQTFLEMVAQLKSHASALGRHAVRKNLNETAQTLEEIKGTCDACHRLFRVIPKGTAPSP